MKLKDKFTGVKMDAEMKQLVEKLAGEARRNVSDYLRLLVEYAATNKIKV